MRKCADCGGDFDTNWSCANACMSCEEIRQNTDRCTVCGIDVRGELNCYGDVVGICSSCFEKIQKEPQVLFKGFKCPDCGSVMEQDMPNIEEWWCAKCLNRKATMVKIRPNVFQFVYK